MQATEQPVGTATEEALHSTKVRTTVGDTKDLHDEPAAFRRVNVNFALETYEALARTAKLKKITMSEVLRQAIALNDYIEDARRNGARILLERNGQLRELVIR